ncbi:MAG: NADH-quinone oxidoreductase subunit J [Planctomycetota bacterium]|jgi:NADH-quinone oxidoreductase subunit J|nr:NADH-quinone oxidoreductase subunit J [Planctomycetota bacterium]
METLFFTIFSIMAIAGGFFTIAKKNPLASAMSLTITFLAIAGMYSLLDAPILAVFQILVYAGAIMVLVIFVIMLINQPDEEYAKEKIGRARLTVGIVLGVFLLGILLKVIGSINIPMPPDTPEGFGGINQLGLTLFRSYLYPFEIISILLLVAIVGAVILAARHRQ